MLKQQYIDAAYFDKVFGTAEVKAASIIKDNHTETIYEATGVDYLFEKDSINIFDIQKDKIVDKDYYIDSPVKFTFLRHDYNYDGATVLHIGVILNNILNEVQVRCHEVLIEWDDTSFNNLTIEEFLNQYK